jgi:hypothetical protein
MVLRGYYDELAEFLNGMADEVLTEKQDTNAPTGSTEAFTYGYNTGLAKAASTLRMTASKLKEKSDG